MNTDHDFDGLYDLRDLQDSDAWFTDAAARSLGTTDPLSPSVIAMLERLDRELASLAPLDRGTVTALITGLNEPPLEVRPSRPASTGAARRVRRNLIVVGVTGALLVAAGGVAAASPGSLFYPVREATLGAADEHAAPEDLSVAESELNRIEVRIGEAQQAGGISESARTELARRMGAIHPIVERASGEQADALRERWTRDDLVLIALPHLTVTEAPPATATAPATSPAPAPDSSTAPAPTPTTPSRDGGGTPPTPRTHPSTPPAPHPTSPSGGGHESSAPTPEPSPSSSHGDGEHQSSPPPAPDHTKSPKPTPTSTPTSGSGTGTGTSKND
jgi:hypothetical protein